MSRNSLICIVICSWFIKKIGHELTTHAEYKPTIKVIEDIFVESGCLEDDDMTSHYIKVRKTDKARSNHSLHCKIYERLDD